MFLSLIFFFLQRIKPTCGTSVPLVDYHEDVNAACPDQLDFLGPAKAASHRKWLLIFWTPSSDTNQFHSVSFFQCFHFGGDLISFFSAMKRQPFRFSDVKPFFLFSSSLSFSDVYYNAIRETKDGRDERMSN